MNIICEQPNFLVIDDFLSQGDHDEMWKYCQSDDYHIVNREKWSKVWRPSDGNPMYGSLIFSNSLVEEHLKRTKGYKTGEFFTCPIGNIVDTFLASLDSIISSITSIIGKKNEEWLGSTFKSYIYPEGTGLSWHQDIAYSGAFIYYANPEWRANWGGELFLAKHIQGVDIRIRHNHLDSNGQKIMIGGHLDSSQEDKVLLESGIGTFVMPKPNRLVILGGGIAHKINRVNIGVGSQPRVSCSGFFIKKDG